MTGTTFGTAYATSWSPTSWRHGLEPPAVTGDATPPVVVGLHDGPDGERVLEWAVREAAALGAPVRAVTAWAWDARLLSAVGVRPRRHADRLRARQDEQVAHVLRRVGPGGCPIETEVVEGDPASRLLALSASARLLVVGSHAEHGLGAVGSVARACLHAAACPVVVVPVPAAS